MGFFVALGVDGRNELFSCMVGVGRESTRVGREFVSGS